MPDEDKRRYYSKPESYDLYKVLTFDFNHRYFVLWTLPLEITYYLFIPVFVLAVLKLRSYWWAAFIPAYYWILYEGWNAYRWDHMKLSPHAPTFLAGSMSAVIFVKLDMRIKSKSLTPRPAFLCLIRAVGIIALWLVDTGICFRGLLFDWFHANIAPQTRFPFISVLLTVVLVIEMLLPSCVSTLFEWNVLRYCGKVSFSIYLLHGFVIYADAISGQPSYYDRLFSRFGLTLFVATASFTWSSIRPNL